MTSVLSRYLSVNDENAIRVASYIIDHSPNFSHAAERMGVTSRTLVRWRSPGGPLSIRFPIQEQSLGRFKLDSPLEVSEDGRTYLYAIMMKGKIVYIGQTRQPEKRMMSHLNSGIGDICVIFRSYQRYRDAINAESRAISLLVKWGSDLRNRSWGQCCSNRIKGQPMRVSGKLK
jgi:predicted GIY-YIG superfamily endonuclease